MSVEKRWPLNLEAEPVICEPLRFRSPQRRQASAFCREMCAFRRKPMVSVRGLFRWRPNQTHVRTNGINLWLAKKHYWNAVLNCFLCSSSQSRRASICKWSSARVTFCKNNKLPRGNWTLSYHRRMTTTCKRRMTSVLYIISFNKFTIHLNRAEKKR